MTSYFSSLENAVESVLNLFNQQLAFSLDIVRIYSSLVKN